MRTIKQILVIYIVSYAVIIFAAILTLLIKPDISSDFAGAIAVMALVIAITSIFAEFSLAEKLKEWQKTN